jgi:hypothetical protein
MCNPSRELDARVAIEVMGFKDVTMNILGHPEYTVVHPNGDLQFGVPVPLYSLGWGAAGDVLERLVSLNYSPDVIHRGRGMWGCEIDRFSEDEVERWPLREDALTAPHAICLAALKAVGGESA